MGNRALIEALTIHWSEPWHSKHRFKLVHQRGVLKNVILAAADETLKKFEDMLSEMNSVHRPLISVYSSACDWPLIVSGYVNWHLRLGNTVSLFDKPSRQRWDHMVDVIDASGVGCDSRLKHSYHAEATEVLDDIQNLLTEHQRAGDRPVITPFLHNSSGHVFHACVPSWWDKSRFNPCIERIQNQALPTRVTDGYE
jgi:esterase/lipase superfamily enzyme